MPSVVYAAAAQAEGGRAQPGNPTVQCQSVSLAPSAAPSSGDLVPKYKVDRVW